MASGNKNKSNQSRVVDAVAKPGPGRPPGSRNIDYDKCVIVPKNCSKCPSTEFGRRQHIKTRMISGTVDGQPYNCVSHYKTRCANPKCQQALFLIEYRMILQASEESGYDEPVDDEFDLGGLLDAKENHE